MFTFVFLEKIHVKVHVNVFCFAQNALDLPLGLHLADECKDKQIIWQL